MTDKSALNRGTFWAAARGWRVETWSTIILALLVCLFIGWMHLAQQREMTETTHKLDSLRIARVELTKGFLMACMSDRPSSPYQREQGLALIRQSLGSFEKVAKDSGFGSEAQRKTFQNEIEALQSSLRGWNHDVSAQQMVAALLAHHRLETLAGALDAQAREALLATAARVKTMFLAALLGSSLLLGLLCSLVYFSGRARRAAELAREATAQRQAITLKSIGDGVIATDGQGRVELLNAVAETLTGWTDEQAHGRELTEVFRIVRDGTREPIPNPVSIVLNSGATVELANDTVLISRLGGERHIADSAAPIRDEGGHIAGVVLVFRDQTEDKKIKKALRDSETHFRALADSGQALIWTAGTDKLCNYFNKTWLEFTGRSIEQEMGNGWAEGVHPEDFDRCLEIYVTAFDRREIFSMEYRLRHNSGEFRWIVDQGTPRYDAEGNFLGYIGHCLDISVQKAAEQELAEKRRVLETILDTVPQAIFWKDRQSVYLGCNTALAHYAGLSDSQEIIGRTDYDLIWSREETEAYRADDQAIMASRSPRLKYVERQTQADGRVVWVETSKLPLLDDTGQAVGVMGIYEDITDRVRAAEQLEQSRLAADAANRAKSEFLANMSHEIRTPLNGLLGMIQLIRGANVPPDVETYADMAERAGNRLTGLLGDILDLSRIEAGKMPIQARPFALRNIVEAMTETFSPVNYSRSVKFSLQVAKDVPKRLVGDEIRVRQVLFNLVGNAMKFTEKGHVQLHISLLAPHPSGAARLLFVVNDNGAGIPDDQMTEIFNPFAQAAQSTSKARQGAGLGLAITQRLVQAMGGTLAFDSTLGKGTDVYLTLPFAKAKTGDTLRAEATVSASLPPLRILLVEDEEISRLSARISLERDGHTVVTAASGQEAIDVLKTQSFDCVLMDVQMEGLDGVATTRLIRQGAYGVLDPAVPIVAMTAYAMSGDRERFLEAGMSDYVAKPVQRDALARALANVAAARGRASG